MNFKMEGMDYSWVPRDYLVNGSKIDKELCVGVKTIGRTILGAVFMRNYDIRFFRDKGVV